MDSCHGAATAGQDGLHRAFAHCTPSIASATLDPTVLPPLPPSPARVSAGIALRDPRLPVHRFRRSWLSATLGLTPTTQ